HRRQQRRPCSPPPRRPFPGSGGPRRRARFAEHPVVSAAAAPTLLLPERSAHRGAGALEPPDLPRLANSARISLSPQEAEEFAPKIQQVVDWFGQLQSVDLESIEPSLRADTAAGSSLREDKAEPFANRDAIIEALPSYDDPYIKVPNALTKE
ncbi:hypothetical protein ZWY2020_030268, partial [Hordeum vulgare]